MSLRPWAGARAQLLPAVPAAAGRAAGAAGHTQLQRAPPCRVSDQAKCTVSVNPGLARARSYYPLYPPPPGALLDAALAAAALPLPATPDLLLLPSSLAPFARCVPLPAAPPDAAAAPGAAAGAPPAAAAGAAGGGSGGGGGTVVCVNPGRLAKGAAGGTYAELHMGASAEGLAAAAGQPPATNAPLPHRLHERCKVEIRRV